MPKQKNLVLIKAGGQLLTDKSKPFTPNTQNIGFFINQFQEVYKKYNEDYDFILGTGAGSFGHFTAHEYGLRDGAKTDKQFLGVAIAHNGVQSLNSMISNSFNQKGIPAMSLSPSSIFTTSNSEIDTKYFDSLDECLKNKLVPVLYGDAVLDIKKGVTICSTEQVFEACINHLKDHYQNITLIYLMTTDGVLDEYKNTISKFTKNTSLVVHETDKHDVTGSVESKVKYAQKAKKLCTHVYLISGLKSGEISKTLQGEEVGTEII